MKKLAVVGAMCTSAVSAASQTPSVMGTWLAASGVAKVRIGPCADPANGPVCGFVVGLIDPKGPDGTLRRRGHVGSPMFGETQIWTRVDQ